MISLFWIESCAENLLLNTLYINKLELSLKNPGLSC